MRTALCLLIVMLLLSASAGAEGFSDSWSLQFDLGAVLEDIDSMAALAVAAVRTVAVIVTVLLIISVGLAFWQAKDSYALEMIKTRLIFIFVGLLLIFSTEPLVRFIFSVLGW